MGLDVRVFVGDRAVASVSPFDRGLAYGDGLFETMRAWRGRIPWWSRHWARLARGAEVLGIDLPDEGLVRAGVVDLLGGRGGVAKLVVTRGTGLRGYAPSDGPPCWVVSRHDALAARASISLRWCDTRLAIQPRLAGIKHCNRLEQVLARAEWGAGVDADEGLMCDTAGDVVSAVAGNVFVRVRGRWLTPPVDRCGVRGVCRDWAVDALQAAEERMVPGHVVEADALFVCNAVRGILEVERLGDRTWAPHPDIARLRQRLALDHPAFAPDQETT